MTWLGRGAVAAFSVVVWVTVTTSPWMRGAPHDVTVYEQAAERMAGGDLPYRDFFLEYPPGAALVFWLARVVPLEYSTGLSVLLCVAMVVTVLAAMSTARAVGFTATREAAVGVVAALTPALLGRFTGQRFDLVVSALLAVMLLCAVTDRFGWMWAVLGAAVVVKLVPVLLVPILVIWQLQRRPQTLWRDGAIGAGVVAIGMVPPLIAAPSGFFRMLDYHLSRPLQIESLGASALHAVVRLFGGHLTITYEYGADHVAGGVGRVMAVGMFVAFIAAACVLAVLYYRRGSASPQVFLSFVAVAILLIVVTSKVLSPQFMLWLIPAVLLVPGRRGWIALGLTPIILVLTQMEFPYYYRPLLAGEFSGVATVLGRNLLLVALIVICWPRRDQPDTLNGAMAVARPSGPASMSAP